MTIWTYKLVPFARMSSSSIHNTETNFNDLGREGWEFICVHQISPAGTAPQPYAVFKQAKTA